MGDTNRVNPAIETWDGPLGLPRQEAIADSDHDPQALERTEERLFALRAAARKLNTTVDALPTLRQRLREQLRLIEDGADALAQAGRDAAAALEAYDLAATLLTSAREAAALVDAALHAPAREAAAATIGAHLAAHGGLAVLIDYGHLQTGIGDTFQAMRGHDFADPLAEPGLADLTSHVDFEALARAAASEGARALPAMTQGAFLLGGGIVERAGALGAGKDASAQDAIRADVTRLCGDGDGQMGALFKVLGLTGPGLEGPVPPFQAG